MKEVSLKRYKIYEYIRDSKEVTAEISNTRKIIEKIMRKDKETLEFCQKKIWEERQEIEAAKIGEHFHENMTKREILVNEISQYMYWLTILEISEKIDGTNSKIEEQINQILDQIDINQIGETKEIILEEVIEHDIEQMREKEYLKEVIEK